VVFQGQDCIIEVESSGSDRIELNIEYITNKHLVTLEKIIVHHLEVYASVHVQRSPKIFSGTPATLVLTRAAAPTHSGIGVLTQTIPREQCCHLRSSGFDSPQLRNF
jgi:hypothetical protein